MQCLPANFSGKVIVTTSPRLAWPNTAGLLQLLLSSVSHARQLTSSDPTFAPRIPLSSPENNHRVHLSLVCPTTRVSCGGMYPGRGQMSSTGADDVPAYSHARHLIFKCVTSRRFISKKRRGHSSSSVYFSSRANVEA